MNDCFLKLKYISIFITNINKFLKFINLIIFFIFKDLIKSKYNIK